MHQPATTDHVLAMLTARGLLDLIDRVCAHRGVTHHELCGSRRTRAVARARHELWSLIHDHPLRNHSYPEIARLVGRDHSTVLYGINAHRRRHLLPCPPPHQRVQP